jgi:hypothetical protein
MCVLHARILDWRVFYFAFYLIIQSHCKPDSNGRPDAEVAQEWWKNHLFREFSVIVALFSGQYKSVLTCEETGFESARFEPFTCLQVHTS